MPLDVDQGTGTNAMLSRTAADFMRGMINAAGKHIRFPDDSPQVAADTTSPEDVRAGAPSAKVDPSPTPILSGPAGTAPGLLTYIS